MPFGKAGHLWLPVLLKRHAFIVPLNSGHNLESGSFMAARALKEILVNAGTAYEELDLLISGSATYDYPIPHNSCLIQHELGKASTIPSFDVDSTCMGFLTAMEVASYFIQGGRHKTIAIVCSEIASRSLNPADWETMTLLGDGAAAVILTAATTEDASAVHGIHMKTFPEGAHSTLVQGGGNQLLNRPNRPDLDPALFSFHMDGWKLIKLGQLHLPPFCEELFCRADVPMAAIDVVIPHQASRLAFHLFECTFSQLGAKTVRNLEQVGNCLSASIHIALHDAIHTGRLKRGDRTLLIGTAAGFSIGGIVLTY
jgi:3-oxoacyl-[acyl-carrier-protein] synthase-3